MQLKYLSIVTSYLRSLSSTSTTTKVEGKHRENSINKLFVPENDLFPYEKLKVLGQGSFGQVLKARNKTTQEMVALKRIMEYDEEVGLSEYERIEEDILGILSHQNVISFYGCCIERQARTEACYYLVLELCHLDLEGLLGSRLDILVGQKKNIMKQILLGLQYIHGQNVMQLDVKPQNILLTKTGVVKLADFGLAQRIKLNGDQPFNSVVTRWYRPPEILLGKKNFGPAVDMWGAGCIMAELWTRSPIMRGSDNQNQLNLISRLCGSLNSSDWSELENDNKLKFAMGFKRQVKTKFEMMGPEACDLLDQLLIVDPSKRIDAKTALGHKFFWTGARPSDLRPLLEDASEVEISTMTFSRWLSLPFKCYANSYLILPVLILYFYFLFFFTTYFKLPMPAIM